MSIVSVIFAPIVGFFGVLVGALLVDFLNKKNEKSNFYRRLFIFYKSRIEKLKSLEGSMLTLSKWNEPDLTIARAPLLAELYLLSSKDVIDAEHKFYSAIWSRETNFVMKRRHYEKTGNQLFARPNMGIYENIALEQANLKKAWENFDQKFELLLKAMRDDINSLLPQGLRNIFKYIIKDEDIVINWSRESPLEATIENISSVNKDSETAEMLLRGRIADEKAQEGVTPLELHLFTNHHHAKEALGFSYEPKAQDSSGFDMFFISDNNSVSEIKKKTNEYFSKVPKGKVRLVRWNDDIKWFKFDASLTSSEIETLHRLIDNWATHQQQKIEDDRTAKSRAWEKVITDSGKTIPAWRGIE